MWVKLIAVNIYYSYMSFSEDYDVFRLWSWWSVPCAVSLWSRTTISIQLLILCHTHGCSTEHIWRESLAVHVQK